MKSDNNIKSIFVINGSASSKSANGVLIEYLAQSAKDYFQFIICDDLKKFPHFDPELSLGNTPKKILEFRENIDKADGVIICTPEYVFSIPSGLKNVIEWCVSTTIFSGKPVGIITASASGEKGHEELQLIMKTLMAKFVPETTLIIQGMKGKVKGEFVDEKTKNDLNGFVESLRKLVG